MAISLKDEDVYIFDIEADNLLDDVTKIHCLSVGRINKKGEFKIKSFTEYEDMIAFFLDKSMTKVGHNILRYDIPAAEKVLGIKIPTNNLIDTLPLSWYLYGAEVVKHGLEEWGEVFGVKKPEIKDWSGLSQEEYIHRCQEDIKINQKLWAEQKAYLLKLYGSEEAAIKFIKYSNFKSLCVREQEEIGIRLDKERCEKVLAQLEAEKAEKIAQLAAAMPKVEKYSDKTKPKAMYKKDGTFSATWLKWVEFCKEYGVPEDYEGDKVQYVSGYEEANPQSVKQVKEWLYSYDWIPETFSFTRDKVTNQFKQVEQVYNKETGEVCNSVKKLIDKEPNIELLNGLGKLKHRIGIFSGFLRDAKEQEDGTWRLYPSMSGYTNTLRLQHKIIVNLPKPGLYMGDEIRGCLIADEGHILCGADLSNIESNTRNHYIKKYDNVYVESLQREDFDSHIDIAVLSGMMSKEDGEWFVAMSLKMEKEGYHLTEEEAKRYKPLKKIRGNAKVANFSCTYGVAKKTLSRNTGLPEKEAQKLIDTYWERNWSIKAFAEDCKTKVVEGQMWIQNPVSGFFIALRSDKDKFSSVNQSTAVFCLDVWLSYVRKMGIKVAYQCHDEILFNLLEDQEQEVRNILQHAIDLTNQELGLNITVKQVPAFGLSYSTVH